MGMKEITQDTVNQFLDDLRLSGKTNMYEASPYVQKKFNITKYEANRFLIKWMETFGERKASEDVKRYTDKVEKLYEEGLFTKRGVVEDWED
jgi:hypothetical protein